MLGKISTDTENRAVVAGWANSDGSSRLSIPLRLRDSYAPKTAKGPTLAGQPFHSGSSTKPYRVDGGNYRV